MNNNRFILGLARYSTDVTSKYSDRKLAYATVKSDIYALWQAVSLAHLVPSCPEFIRLLTERCGEIDSTGRPSFREISRDIVAGPIRDFGAATSRSKSVHKASRSAALSLLAATGTAVATILKGARQRKTVTARVTHSHRRLLKASVAGEVDSSAVTIAGDLAAGDRLSRGLHLRELPRQPKHGLHVTAPAAFRSDLGGGFDSNSDDHNEDLLGDTPSTPDKFSAARLLCWFVLLR